MLRVRFPNGQCITYNDAYSFKTYNQSHDLYNKSGLFIASAPLGCIVEGVDPCKIENPMIELTLDKAFEMVIESMGKREVNRGLADIKRLLKNYNISRCEWND